jgi:GNAT superfamily N-acetyltransferase
VAAASLVNKQASTSKNEGLQQVDFIRDLRQIADLIEICFADHMDTGGRAAVNEMRAVSYLGPFLILLSWLDRISPGIGTGYVWRVDNKVVGNVSMYRAGYHPDLGEGWLIANVAVHPDYRRQGIAEAMMKAAVAHAYRHHARWATLEVDAKNVGARALYEKLDFTTYETLSQWECIGYYGETQALPDPRWLVLLRVPGEAAQEMDLILHRARVGAMAWTHPIDRSQIYDGVFDSLLAVISASPKEHWLLSDHMNPAHLLGVLWIEALGMRSVRISQFLDPDLLDAGGRRALLEHLLNMNAYHGWSIRIETPADDVPVENLLLSRNFRRLRSLTQMRLMLNN